MENTTIVSSGFADIITVVNPFEEVEQIKQREFELSYMTRCIIRKMELDNMRDIVRLFNKDVRSII